MQEQLRAVFVAAVVCTVALLFSFSPASAHTAVVVCDDATGELVWSNVDAVDGPATIVTSNGLTVDVPGGGETRTPYPGPGTWIATWADGVEVEGDIPPACVETTTTAPPTTAPPTTAPPTTAPPTTAPPTTATAPPTSEAGSNTVVPPTSAARSGRLPDTGAGGAAILAGFVLLGAGVLVTVIARRRAAEST